MEDEPNVSVEVEVEPEPEPEAEPEAVAIVVEAPSSEPLVEHVSSDVDRWVDNADAHSSLDARVRELEQRDWNKPTVEEVKNIVEDEVADIEENEAEVEPVAEVEIETETTPEGVQETEIEIDIPPVEGVTGKHRSSWDVFEEIHGEE